MYADDAIIYTAASSLERALQQFQDADVTKVIIKVTEVLQCSLLKLKLVLNLNKIKYMILSCGRTKVTDLTITTLNYSFIERVGSYKYLVFGLMKD